MHWRVGAALQTQYFLTKAFETQNNWDVSCVPLLPCFGTYLGVSAEIQAKMLRAVSRNGNNRHLGDRCLLKPINVSFFVEGDLPNRKTQTIKR